MTIDRLRAQGESISFRQMKLFESVGRLGSVRRGSEECNLSQPAVTQALSKLEQQIGVSLLERRASGSFLTREGEIFHLRVQRFFDQFELGLMAFGGGSRSVAAAIVGRISRAQVRSLLTLIEYRSFANAAQQLGVTQASLQRAARDLEGNLRKPLFHRTAGGVILTHAAIELGRRIRLATQEIEWALREIEACRGVEGSILAIGALPFGGSMLLASVLSEFIATHPGTEVRITTESASEMLKRLRFGDVDLVIGIVQETTGQDIVNVPMALTPFRVVARKSHPLASKTSITTQDLLGYEWIVGMEGASRRACFDQIFQGLTPPRSPIATSTLPIIRHVVTGTDRLTLMTSYELEHEGEKLVALPFELIEPGPAVGVAMRTDWLPTQVHKNFLDLVQKMIGDKSKGAVA